MTQEWQVFAISGARREAALRRFHRRIHGMGIVNYGAYKRRLKRMNHIDRDYHKLRLRSIVAAARSGIDAEQWQDFYYGELERLGELAPQQVAARLSRLS